MSKNVKMGNARRRKAAAIKDVVEFLLEKRRKQWNYAICPACGNDLRATGECYFLADADVRKHLKRHTEKELRDGLIIAAMSGE